MKLAAAAILTGAGFLATGPVAVASAKNVASDTATAAGHPGGLLPGVLESPQITYESDGYNAKQCSGPPSSALNYIVFYPSTPGPHPVVFGMTGSAFSGNADCNAKTGQAEFQGIDLTMEHWAQDGFVAVNVEYHGVVNGLHGDVTYPGPGNWGNIADGTTQLDVKPAITYFFNNNPGQYGASENAGVIAFGGSSGAHNAYMVADTGVPGVPIWAAVGWSGLPDVALAGSYPEGIFDGYMQTQPGTDIENFGDPEHRISATSPPQYIANGTNEFINPANAEQYYQTCTQLHIPFCYERIPNTSDHASAYENYIFTGRPPELTSPAATPGQTVLEDTLAYANAVIAAGPPHSAPPGVSPPSPPTPTISALSISPNKPKLTGVTVRAVCVKRTSRRHGRLCNLPVKLKIRFSLNSPDIVVLTVQHEVGGRRVGGKCVKRTVKNHTHRFCWRWVKLYGQRTFTGTLGANVYTFNGKIGGHKLGPGTYALTLTPSGGIGGQVIFKLLA